MSGRKIVTMREALESPAYFGTDQLLGGVSWDAWKVVLIASMGEALRDYERVVFKQLTGRDAEPGEMVHELWGICGRRAGKSRAIAALIVYLACFVDYRHTLAPGQRALIPVIAASREQAEEIHDYAVGLFNTVECLTQLMDGAPTAGMIKLTTRVHIAIRTASFRHARGFTAVAVVLEEACFFRSEDSSNPDKEIVTAVRYALATTHGPLIVISSPYAKSGEVFVAFCKNYGADGNPLVLVVKASSKEMNPLLDDAFIARKYEEDPVAADCELGANFRSDVTGYIGDDVVRPVILNGIFEIAPRDTVRYFGFVDGASGTSSAGDSMTMGIAFKDGEQVVLAHLSERRPPFDPASVVTEFCETLRRYRISRISGDRWATGFVEAEFRRNGIQYEANAKPKSELYKELVPLLTSGGVRLLDNKRMISQLLALERRTSRSGNDIIDHPKHGRDDAINAACGALVSVARGRQPMVISDEMLAASRAIPPRPGTPGFFNRYGHYF